jgi:hypothetical protein
MDTSPYPIKPYIALNRLPPNIQATMSTVPNRQILTNLRDYAEAINQVQYRDHSFSKLTQLITDASVEANQFSTASDAAQPDPLKEGLI